MPRPILSLRPTPALACLALLFICVATPAAASQPATPATAERQNEVREKGAEVMPFSLDQTLHTFDKTDSGGVQRVRVRDAAPDQVAMIRSHLRAIAQSFAERDFSAPAHIHGADMPGMAQMKAAKPDELTVTYRELDDGAELDYESRSPAIINAIHRWFDAQLADHGRDATTSAAGIELGANGRNGTMTARIEGSDGGNDFPEEYPHRRRHDRRAD